MDLNTLTHASIVLNTPPMVFITNAMPSSDKGLWDYVCDIIKILGPLITAYVAVGQYRLSRKQHKLQKNQFYLSEEQKGISNTQKEIARGKLKLEVYEKRYDLYKAFNDKLFEFKTKIYRGSYDDLMKIFDCLASMSYEYLFLYNRDVGGKVNLMARNCLQISILKRNYDDKKISWEEFIKETDSLIVVMTTFINADFPALVEPFLNLDEIDHL